MNFLYFRQSQKLKGSFSCKERALGVIQGYFQLHGTMQLCFKLSRKSTGERDTCEGPALLPNKQKYSFMVVYFSLMF